MKFPAKILLFGEFTLIKGSQGLAIPFEHFHCNLSYKRDKALADSTVILQKIHNYIVKQDDLASIINSTQFQKDIDAGLQINMDIPIGYGLGSSGALTACVYEDYTSKKEEDVNILQDILGRLESVFHGKSSGLDPLVAYLRKAIWIDGESRNHEIDFSIDFDEQFYLFLVNTGNSRSTAPLVNSFLERCEKKDYLSVIEQEVIPINNELIENMLSKEWEAILPLFKKLSSQQLTTFSTHILPEHIDLWETGLNTDDYYLKICGAGGGGFMLGICSDKSKVKSSFKEKEITWI